MDSYHGYKMVNSSIWFTIVIVDKVHLCWFQTSLSLAALLLRRVVIACCFRVAALSSHATLALSPSGIAPQLNRIQLSAICRSGQSGKVIDLLARGCLPLCHPSAASGACAFIQNSPPKRQCGERQASLKAASVSHIQQMYDGFFYNAPLFCCTVHLMNRWDPKYTFYKKYPRFKSVITLI